MKRFSRWAIALVIATCAALAWVAWFGVPVESPALRDRLAVALGNAAGHVVRIEGPMRARVSLWPEVVLTGVVVESGPGFKTRDLASVEALRLAVDLLPLLHGEVRVRDLAASGIEIRLEHDADGRGNWTPQRADAPAPREGRSDVPELDLHRIAIERAAVTLPSGRRVDVDTAALHAPRGERMQADLRGRVDGQRGWSATFDAAALDLLLDDGAWPFTLRAVSGDVALTAEGTVAKALSAPNVAVRVGAGVADLQALAKAFGASLPALGAAALSADVAVDGGRWSFERVNAALGDASIAGRLAYDGAAPRRRLEGALAATTLDVTPWAAPVEGKQGPPQTLAQTFRDLEGTDIDPRRFADLDVDLQLEVGYVAGLPGDLRDVKLRVSGSRDKVEMPLAFMLAGARFSGEARVGLDATPAAYHVNLAASDSPFGGIAEVIFGAPYVDGRIREMRFELDSAGATVGELVKALDVRARLAGAALTYGNFEGGVPVRMTLDRVELTQPRGGALSAKIDGTLLGRPLRGTLRADPVDAIVRTGGTRLALEANSGSVRATVDGRLAEPRPARGTDLAFRVAAQRAAELAPWLGFASDSALPADLRGNVQVRSTGTSLLGLSADIGKTALKGDVIAAVVDRRKVRRIALSAPRIDIDELATLLPKPDPQRTRATVDIPLLPARVQFGDADLDVGVKRIDGLAMSVGDVAFAGHLRDGDLPAGPLSLSLEGVPLEGAIAADLRGDVPRMQLWLQGRDVDMARWLRAFGLGTNVEASAGELRLHADIRDTTVGRSLDASALVMNIANGRFVVRDRNTKAAFRLRVEAGEVRADPGTPLTVALHGRVFRAPVELRAVTGKLRQFVDAKRLPLDVQLRGAGAQLTIAGEVAPRVASPDVDLVVGLTGTTFADLAPLLRTSLPPWGPYGGAARVRISSWGYEVEDLRFAVGASVLEGRGALNTARPKPLLDVALAASTLQLDDFPLNDWSPFDAAAAASLDGAQRNLAATIQESAAETSAQVQALLDPAMLASFDANTRVEVRQVLSGRDRLGRGEARAKIEGGALEVDPVEVEMVGGSARFAASYRPRGDAIDTHARVRVDRFDYGVLARRVKPDSKLGGTFSVDIDVTGSSPELSGAIASGNGHVDVAVWPERLDASVFDLWATNLFLALLPALDTDVSRVNCAIGEFDLKAGVLSSQRLLIDTTHTRAAGSMVANLPGDALDARLVPQPKVPQFFALATPVEATGTLRDFRVRVRPADVLVTALRWAGSLVTVPIRKLTETPPPADGSDVCGPGLRGTR